MTGATGSDSTLEYYTVHYTRNTLLTVSKDLVRVRLPMLERREYLSYSIEPAR